MPVFNGEDLDSWLFYTERPIASAKTGTNYVVGEKGNTTFPIGTITLRSSNAAEVRKEGTLKRLPDVVFQARKEKGLCFRCNEKYSADHKSKMKEQRELQMFVVVNETEKYEIIEENETEGKEINRLEVKGDNTSYVELSINSVVGLNDPGTMKKLVEKLHLPSKETTHYGVILGLGIAIQRKGVCEALEVQLKDWTVREDFLPLKLGGVDIMLGIQWLYSLRVTVVNWKNLTLSFSSLGKQVCIKGDLSLTKARVSLKSMMKSWGEKDEGFLIECHAIEVEGLFRNESYAFSFGSVCRHL
ncbi:ty3-gypsy retrotransposon protein [Cucumis melo var. makuwa]|uniref:Ty3-gypsy retrotransposon protein n=1 Tax=Cucumis melo var. makuwa TaxID=1194695 RepID=A0A5A7T6Z3_CUCMM|nr:ty3-gypsy retrotransposon protein [Cucumis melo var. makuwa]